MAIDGHRSTYPATIDDWGAEYQDDLGQKWAAAAWNRIQDGLFQLEGHTLGVVQTGQAGVLTHAVTGSARPAMLVKTATVVYGGATSGIVDLGMPVFTSAEKTLFAGTPLASGNLVHVEVRKVSGDTNRERSYHAGLVSPIGDPSGDSGWSVRIANLRHGNGQTTVDSGTYVVSVLITAG